MDWRVCDRCDSVLLGRPRIMNASYREPRDAKHQDKNYAYELTLELRHQTEVRNWRRSGSRSATCASRRASSAKSPRRRARRSRSSSFRSKIIQARWSGEAAWVPLSDFDLGMARNDDSDASARRDPLLPSRDKQNGDPLPLRTGIIREQTAGWPATTS